MQNTRNSLEHAVEFAENSESRCPVVIVFDTSASMSGEPINQANAGLHDLKEELQKDDLASKRVEIALVSFNSVVTVEQDFVTVDQFPTPTLVAGGSTCLGAGLEKALDLIEKRKDDYRENGVTYYRPWLFLITDGEPTDDVSRAVQRLKEAEAKNKVTCFAVGVEGANINRLAEIIVRPPAKLNGLDFKAMFQWLSSSLAEVAHSQVNDQIALPPVDWGTVQPAEAR
jgi:uncharacterized protein YegL